MINQDTSSFDFKLGAIAQDLAHLNIECAQNGHESVCQHALKTRRQEERVLTSCIGLGVYSTKVFVGGLPQDIDQEGIEDSFGHLGSLYVEWPGKEASRSPFPPKGYAFLMFSCEGSVFDLLESCVHEGGDKYFTHLSSPSMTHKKVQIRPWKCVDACWLANPNMPVDPRKAVFVGGVPRTLTAKDLWEQVENIFGGVQLCEIDVDKDMKYPKGAARITFATQGCFIAAVVARFITVQQDGVQKRVEMKPFLLDNQTCDECSKCIGALYCPCLGCFKYFCQSCWKNYHKTSDLMQNHKPLQKDADRIPRASNMQTF